MHKITIDPGGRIIESCVSGFLTIHEVSAYIDAIEPVIRRCAAKGSYKMIIDVSACAIQSPDVVLAFQEHVQRMPKASLLAVVADSALVSMQISRIEKGTGVKLFSNRDDAFQWLG